MEELPKVREDISENSSQEKDSKLNVNLKRKEDEYLIMLNEVPKSIKKKRNHQGFRQS